MPWKARDQENDNLQISKREQELQQQKLAAKLDADH